MPSHSTPKPHSRTFEGLCSDLIASHHKTIKRREKMLMDTKAELNKNWGLLCRAIQDQKDGNPEESIVSSCIQFLVSQRVELQNQAAQIKKIKRAWQLEESEFVLHKPAKKAPRTKKRPRVF